MSFMIFVQFFEDGEKDKVPTDGVTAKFGSAFIREGSDVGLVYSEKEYPELYGSFSEPTIDSFSVASPPLSIEFWESLLSILTKEGAVLLIPGFNGVVMANGNTEKQLPIDLLDSLSEKITVTAASEILDIIRNA